MADAVQVTQETAKYSDNLLNAFCAFNDDTFTWNVVSGGSNATLSNTNAQVYDGDNALKIDFLGTSPIIFNCGGSQMDFTAKHAGEYYFSYRFFKEFFDADITFSIDIFVNEVPYETISQNLYISSGYTDEVWNCYMYNLSLNENDVVSFQFTAQVDTIGSALYFDGLKMEYNNIGLMANPTYYTTPYIQNYIQTNIIDIPSISSNTSYEVISELIGAKVGDFVIMNYPSELISLGLIVSLPLITSDDEVRFILYNSSGSSVNPESGNYTFKTIK